jgi:hypothetical protein
LARLSLQITNLQRLYADLGEPGATTAEAGQSPRLVAQPDLDGSIGCGDAEASGLVNFVR